jgi:hypothetical protein
LAKSFPTLVTQSPYLEFVGACLLRTISPPFMANWT